MKRGSSPFSACSRKLPVVDKSIARPMEIGIVKNEAGAEDRTDVRGVTRGYSRSQCTEGKHFEKR